MYTDKFISKDELRRQSPTQITKINSTGKGEYTFSIIIPTWNNLAYLQLCIRSIIQNSHFKHSIIIIINEGKDGTLEWVKSQIEIDYVHSSENIGICYGLNICRSQVKSDYIVYVNDDMYLLPDWDLELYKEIENIGHNHFMLSATAIEPVDTNNPCSIVKNYGERIEDFNETQLLNEFRNFTKQDWYGSTWPPVVIHTDMWDLVGGMSIEFSPGMYSDPDLSMKLWKADVRYFKGLGKSRVYHFGSKSTKRVKKNIGQKTFLLKWGITARTFTRKYLKRGQPYSQLLTTPKVGTTDKIINKIKRIYNCI